MNTRLRILNIIFFLLPVLLWAQPYGKTNIVDLALIYHGGVHRDYPWTKEKFLPYVVHQDLSGRKNWLFDGFLFLEFKDGKGRNFAPGYDTLNARRVEWEWLIDRHFEKGKALLALNDAIEDCIQLMGSAPHFRHKVVIGIPSPIRNQKDWGDLGSRTLDFSIIEDRIAASSWYIKEFLTRFEKEKLPYLELAGFYWVDEDISDGKEILIPIGDYIRSQGYKYYWIPYWNAPGNFKWQDFKFDFAWLQPNHFFNNKVDDSRIDDACKKAQEFSMGMEMEFDDRALYRANENKRFRLDTYIDSFIKNKVFQTSAIAYYQGGDSFYKLVNSADLKDREMADKLAAEIIKRKGKKKYKQLIQE
ncbi:DUF4855 domain-containing protein [Sphingobacterium faecale]|uniref:DUF4855 domain-containing protein n=1 Tax=Sphingobacterium faecale TaxID=2803775 RepID=A0ABS1R0P9_9SPHI|nr:DUF4855 domain-containing protein [Sphingobacterium faecale]MBL1408261.1 DUF4855 domain-containing protein [Sphingobacterium faecale]